MCTSVDYIRMSGVISRPNQEMGRLDLQASAWRRRIKSSGEALRRTWEPSSGDPVLVLLASVLELSHFILELL